MKTLVIALSLLLFSCSLIAMENDDPVLWKTNFHQLEWRGADGEGNDQLAWELDAWLGKDYDKLWFKSEGSKTQGDRANYETQLLYGRTISPFWDWQIGWRGQWEDGEQQDDVALAFKGVAPFFVETDISLFAANGRTELRLEFEKELLFTQRWHLVPKLEVTAFGQNDPEHHQASGISEVEFGLRLAYAISPQLAPYAGVLWEREVGDAGSFARRAGGESQENLWVAGVHWWF